MSSVHLLFGTSPRSEQERAAILQGMVERGFGTQAIEAASQGLAAEDAELALVLQYESGQTTGASLQTAALAQARAQAKAARTTSTGSGVSSG